MDFFFEKNSFSFMIFLSFSFYAYPQTTVLNSIPKCGTHLLLKCLRLMFEGEGYPLPGFTQITQEGIDEAGSRLVKGHFVYNVNNVKVVYNNKILSFLMIRDPRDQIVSMQKWVESHPTIWPAFKDMPCKDIYKLLITNCAPIYSVQFEGPEVNSLTDICSFYQLYLPWQNLDNVLVIKFEDLVGSDGGGSDERQLSILREIANFLDISITYEQLKLIGSRLFGNKYTFRKGLIGQWKHAFDHEIIGLFKKYAGQLLIDLGYETCFDW